MEKTYVILLMNNVDHSENDQNIINCIYHWSSSKNLICILEGTLIDHHSYTNLHYIKLPTCKNILELPNPEDLNKCIISVDFDQYHQCLYIKENNQCKYLQYDYVYTDQILGIVVEKNNYMNILQNFSKTLDQKIYKLFLINLNMQCMYTTLEIDLQQILYWKYNTHKIIYEAHCNINVDYNDSFSILNINEVVINLNNILNTKIQLYDSIDSSVNQYDQLQIKNIPNIPFLILNIYIFFFNFYIIFIFIFF